MKPMKSTNFMSKFTTFLIIILCSLVLISHVGVQARPNSVSSKLTSEPSVSITIMKAFYGDADGDGNADDVIAYVEHHLSGAVRYQLSVYATLVLPSGLEYTWYYGLNTRLSKVTLVLYFYNHALETGDYTLMINAFLKTGGISHAQDTHVFDPPGGKGDNPPDFEATFA